MYTIDELKKFKKEKKMTFKELSDISGIPQSTIYDIFRGITTAPRIDTMQAIENALGLSENEKKPVNSYEPSEKEMKLLMAFSRLIPSLQDYIIETTEKMLATQESKGVSDNTTAKKKNA